MALTSPAFNCLWQTDQIRETLFELLSKEDMCNVRRTSSACCNLVTKRLFKRTHLSFTATSFTRQSRVQALARIGHHIEHLTFHFPHSEATFLPPLVHPDSGREISFLYKPHTSIASVLERPKFANSGLGHVLTEQYPPLFHAASNVPAFIHAAKHLVNLRHLTIRTPGQDPKERYRRDIVDYALISLRIAIERCPLARLSKLSLVSVHPAAFMYLSHMPGGFGSLPSASRRWRQIRRMSISVEAWDFYSASPGLDHLKMMEDFIRSFSPSLEKLSFTWLGRKGPCPLSLATDPLFAPPRCSQKLFHEVTSPMSPLPPAPARKPVVLPRARYLAVRNATMNERQVADLVSAHQYNVREFDFENVVLINAGSWDAALAPLLQHPCTKDNWSRYSSATLGDTLESILSLRGDDGAATLSSPADLSGHSAAVAALSRELLDMSIGLDDGELLDDDYDDDDDDDIVVDQQTLARPDLDSDLEAARQASVTDLCKQKKRRVTKRRRRRKDGHHERAAVVTEDEAEAEQEKDFLQRLRDTKAEVSKGLLTREHSFFRRIRHRKAASADASVGSGSVAVMPGTPAQSPVQSPSPSPRPARPVRHRTGAKSASSSPLIPSSPPPLSFHMPPIPTTTYPPQVRLFGEVQRVHSLAPSTCSGSSSTSPGRLFGEIAGPRDSASLLGSEPDLYNSATDDADSLAEDPFSRPETPATPATLTPHRYFHYNHHYNSYNKTSHNNNDSSSTIKISSPILGSQPSMPILLQPAVYDPTAELCSQISAVQRDLAAEEAHRVYAEDVDMQTNALRKARELVLSRMGSQQQQNQQQHYDYSNSYGQRDSRKDSLGSTASSSGGFLSSARFREGLFRRGSPGGGSGSSIPQSLRHHMSGHSSLFDHHRSMDVPILFSRA